MTAEPTFVLGVGATKAGTSWLWRHLAGHPDCHFRTIKELHYFDCVENNRFSGALRRAKADLAALSETLISGTSANAAHLARRVADLKDWIKVLRARALDLAAYRGYLLGGRGNRALVGEVTPAYALLSVDRLREMARMAADVRFVYLMRDPVARLWSHVRMLARRGAPEADYAAVSATLMGQVCAGDAVDQVAAVATRGDYAAAISRLDAAVDPRRLLVMFQEDLITAPGVARLSEFLDIGVQKAALKARVHAGIPLPLSDAQRAEAQEFLRPQYDFAAARFAELPAAWRMNMGEGRA